MAHINKAIDEVRASEHKQLKATGDRETLKNARWALLKNPEHLTDAQNLEDGGLTAEEFEERQMLASARTLPAILYLRLALPRGPVSGSMV